MNQSSGQTKSGIITPFNVIAGLILVSGAAVTILRFTKGLGATTNLTHINPWGIWIGFDVMTGVALAAGGFVISSAVYLFGIDEYKPLVRPAILTGFLGYFLVVVGLLYDLGRYYRLPYPFVVQPGPTSPLFEIALCVGLYLTVLFVEFTPAAFEWLGWKRWRKVVVSMTIALTIFGLIPSTLHQSTLGAMFLITPTKLHPLWYSSYIPVHFFVSAVAAGISMVIFESMLSHKAFNDKVEITHEKFDSLTIGLAKAGSIVLAIYFAIKVMGIVADNKWHYLATPMGAWFLVEPLGFVLLPCFLYLVGYREKRTGLIRFTGLLTVIGIILNRINVSVIAFNWQLPSEMRYVPHWMEVWISITIVTAGVVAFKWIVNRMPILYEHPQYKGMH
ncbi:MAG: polysulfide reductase NrfD [Proteobacteria bacterium]|nr:polysulfide reductase NrfD [Pseudomonadota bacterium]